MYIAVTYIGTDFTPGEVLPDNLDEGMIKRLLKSGAIREDTPEPVRRPAAPETPEAPEPSPEEPEEENVYDEPEAPEIDVTEALVGRPAKPSRKKGGKAG